MNRCIESKIFIFETCFNYPDHYFENNNFEGNITY